MKNSDVIIVGAGAAGLMAARELSRAGKKVIILEARERIGGRIWPMPEQEFWYPAEGGAEFIHGPAKITKALIKEAGLTFVSMEKGEVWNFRERKPIKITEFVTDKNLLHEKLKELKEDMSIAAFLEKYFPGVKHASLRNSIIRMVEDYDAADPYKISTFSLRDEWLGNEEWQQGRIREGYGALLSFLESECTTHGVVMRFNQEVNAVEMNQEGVRISCVKGETYNAQKVILTPSLPILRELRFTPDIPEKIKALSKIGFGGVIKILFRFKNRWWLNALDEDLNKMTFLFSDEEVSVWWTQYPEDEPLLTGWISSSKAEQLKSSSSDAIVELGLTSLSNIFRIDTNKLQNDLVKSSVINWPADPFARGAYSYSMIDSLQAYEELIEPARNAVFFAGEALCNEKNTATVEGALASGLKTAQRMLHTW